MIIYFYISNLNPTNYNRLPFSLDLENKTLPQVSFMGRKMTPLEHNVRLFPNVSLFYVTKQSTLIMANNISNPKEKSTVTWN